MKGTIGSEETTIKLQIQVPFTVYGLNRLEKYLKAKGVQKGRFTERAIMHALNHVESGEDL